MEVYKLRMIVEYQELKRRTEKLGIILYRWLTDDLDFEPSCPFELLESQFHVMKAYLSILKQRAEIENIDLDYGLVSNRSEEEKLYSAKLKYLDVDDEECYINQLINNKRLFLGNLDENDYVKVFFTREELKDLGLWENVLIDTDEVKDD